MKKPHRDEQRGAREAKRYDSLQGIVNDATRPMLERVFVSELADGKSRLISCVDENGNLRLNKTDIGSGDSWA